jgi:Rieske 2Fe-2S family protein
VSVASTLPGRYYHDPTLFELEQERIFSRLWVCVGHQSQLSGPGRYLTARVGGESMLVIRGADGRLRAFLNVCRHRGARLVGDASGQIAGSLRCRYHAWTYGLDGRLIGAPNMEAETFDRSAFGLVPAALGLWEGLVWVTVADDPPPLEEQLVPCVRERFGDDATRVARYGIADLRAGPTVTYVVHANWKLIVENFMECYHCAVVHPELARAFPSFRAGIAYQTGRPAEFAEGVEAFTLSGRASRPPLPGLPPEDHRRYYGLVLRPNAFVNLLPDHVVVHTLWPEAPERTRIVCEWLFEPAAMTQSDFDPGDTVAFFDLVNRQDWEVCELAQQGMSSRAYRAGGVLTPLEQHIRGFLDFVLAELERPAQEVLRAQP